MVMLLFFIHAFLQITVSTCLKGKNNWVKNKIEFAINHIKLNSYTQVLEMVYL